MVSVFALSVVDRWLSNDQVQPKTIKLVFVFAYPLSTQHYGVRTHTGWLGNMIMCQCGVLCVPEDCGFRDPL